MTTALWCVLVAALLPYLAATIAKAGGARYNNRDPRAWLEKQAGWRLRANHAQANAFESFAFFAVAVIVAQMLQAPQERIDALALIFIVARLAHLACYLADWHGARSLAWLIGWLACIFLFVTGAGR
jgi:uncharacterized MAPEG superfamily protein